MLSSFDTVHLVENTQLGFIFGVISEAKKNWMRLHAKDFGREPLIVYNQRLSPKISEFATESSAMRVFVALALAFTLALLSAVVRSPLPLLATPVMFDGESSRGFWAWARDNVQNAATTRKERPGRSQKACPDSRNVWPDRRNVCSGSRNVCPATTVGSVPTART